METLKQRSDYTAPEGPVILAVLDGVGIGACEEGDLVRKAETPTLDWLFEHTPHRTLKAHGKAVGLPSDGDMGNSEVGHNAIGAGRVFSQGARLVNEAIASRSLFEGEVWQSLIKQVKNNNSALHLIGLLSDGNVHSHINHLFALLDETKAENVQRVRIHILLDGRDVPPTSAHEYIQQLEDKLTALNQDDALDYSVASGGGRMNITMDRYNANWDMVARGWATHVHGKGRYFSSASEALEALRSEDPGILDQDLPPFVVGTEEQPVGTIQDNDGVILFNFRGDRAIELTRAFEDDEFDKFDRGHRPNVFFAGMMQYDGDLNIPSNFLVSPPALDRTMGAYLAAAGVKQLAVSETQKYGHVTYFFNGNRSGKFDESLETYVEVPSDMVPFEERPWMKAAEITDTVIDAVRKGEFRFIRLNYPNGDMVGHTGNYLAVEIAVEAVDLQLQRLMKAVKKAKGVLVISADHGNADDMYGRDKKTGAVLIDEQTGMPKPKTSHSLNPVPVFIYDPAQQAGTIRMSEKEDLGISSLAATCLNLLGFEAPEGYDPGVIELD